MRESRPASLPLCCDRYSSRIAASSAALMLLCAAAETNSSSAFAALPRRASSLASLTTAPAGGGLAFMASPSNASSAVSSPFFSYRSASAIVGRAARAGAKAALIDAFSTGFGFVVFLPRGVDVNQRRHRRTKRGARVHCFLVQTLGFVGVAFGGRDARQHLEPA